ncbi:hypothetical protein DMENIID0001_150250 [Sergentomyia squamirostris]
MASCGTRFALLFISIWTIVQGVGYAVLAAMGMQFHNCELDVKSTQVNYVIYLTYFRQSECGDTVLNWDALEIYPTPSMNITLPEVTEVVLRTQTMVLVYLIISCAWVVASIMLIVGAFSPCIKGRVLRFFCYPWALVCLLVLIQDGVATYFYVSDIILSRGVSGFLDLIGIHYDPDYYFIFASIPPHVLILPSLMMSLLSSRGVLGWFINLSCFIYVCITIRKLSKRTRQPEIIATTAGQQHVIQPSAPVVP